MAAQLGLPDALRARGLTVEVVPGWETRSAGSFNPKGAVCHWTAGPANSKTRPSLNICVNGRADLPGPLCNVYLDRNGVAVVVSANRANHAGTGSWRGITGNSAVFGTEAEAAGAADFTDAQRWAYPRINAAYCDLGGFGADMVCGHSEWAGARKTDINGYTMDQMRAQIAALLADPALTEDDMFETANADDLRECRRMLAVLLGAQPAANASEAGTLQKIAATAENSAEARRMLAVVLGAAKPAAGEMAVSGSSDPEVLAAALKSALGENLAADVASRLTVTAA